MPVSKVLARKLNNMLNHQNRLAAVEKVYLNKVGSLQATKAYCETLQAHNTLYRQVANKCIHDLKMSIHDRKIKLGRKLLSLLEKRDYDTWYAEAVKYEYILDNGHVIALHNREQARKRAQAVYVKAVAECVGCSETLPCTRNPNRQWVCSMCWL